MSHVLTTLYAEDEMDIRQVTELALEDEGFELISCSSGEQALDLAKKTKPDLILLDIMMPGMDGPTTLKKLRELAHLSDTPVIFMTAKVQLSEVAEYKALGAIGVISKPFDPMQLADDIRNLYESRND